MHAGLDEDDSSDESVDAGGAFDDDDDLGFDLSQQFASAGGKEAYYKKARDLFYRNGEEHYASMSDDLLKTKGKAGDKGAVWALITAI